TYREIAQYLYDLRQIAKEQIGLVDKDLQNAKEILGEDITDKLTKPEEDFVQDSASLEEFTKMIREEIKQIVEIHTTVDKLDTSFSDSSKKDQLITDLEDKQTQIKILKEELIGARKAKEEAEEELSEKEDEIRLLKGN